MDQATDYILENVTIPSLSYADILKHSFDIIATNQRGFFDLQAELIEINFGLFNNPSIPNFPFVSLAQRGNSLLLSCHCQVLKKKLCQHQVQVLHNVLDRPYLRIFFDSSFRNKEIIQVAKDYGLEKEINLDDYFQVEYVYKSFEIKSKIKELFPVNTNSTGQLKDKLLLEKTILLPLENAEVEQILVFDKHKYHEQFTLHLLEAQINKNGKIKNPVLSLDPTDFLWKTEEIEKVKFYSAISKFQNNTVPKEETDIEGLKIILKNPLGLKVFYQDSEISEKMNANSLIPISLKNLAIDLVLQVDLKENFYEISSELIHDEKPHSLKSIKIKYDYFIQLANTFYLMDNPHLMRMIDFFKKNNEKILIHKSKYEEFRENILLKLEHKINIKYSYIKPATKKQIREQEFDVVKEKIIYLSEHENFILITPVVQYGKVEIPVFSRKQIYDKDLHGNVFKVERDIDLETRFTSVLLRQHSDFNEQLHQPAESFYLHKEKFIDENWFLNAFEEWKGQNILILGFNELKNNKLNSNKAKVTVQVISGIDWFNTSLEVLFGKQKASLKQLQKSIRNKNKFVQLDDGTLGILPEEWIRKMARYFSEGELLEELIRTPKSKFYEIGQIYEQELLSKEVKEEITFYEERFTNVETIQEVEVPKELKATLRDYQKQGLNWLNFLDELNFGACLADDMGLGKTIQIIAFILCQRAKRKNNTNLIVVPTSLLFNWEAEVAKFAPSIKIFTQYGSNKIKKQEFDKYEIILTTYGMLLSDIILLKDYPFNYIFLDESQAIKNPESQRYKTVRMLQSRNKVVLTGTPMENNTFDIYSQFSFACPGLLGNKQSFKELYSDPIDKFGNYKRAAELQKKISPFILRRTKKQVAKELPEKTEMVIYCEMGEEQRKIYNAHEKELRDYIASKKDEDVPKDSMYVLKGLTELRQICNSPILLKEGVQENISSKIEVLMEQIENKSPHHKILVFSQFVGMLDLIKKELEKRNIVFEYLTGQTKNREEKVTKFQTNKEIRVFLISLKAGGVGLNLTEADYVFLVDPWWNPAVENQAIDRIHRIGQKKNVIAVRLICPDTIEDKIRTLQESKTERVNDLIKTDVSILKNLTKTDLMGILKQK